MRDLLAVVTVDRPECLGLDFGEAEVRCDDRLAIRLDLGASQRDLRGDLGGATSGPCQEQNESKTDYREEFSPS